VKEVPKALHTYSRKNCLSNPNTVSESLSDQGHYDYLTNKYKARLHFLRIRNALHPSEVQTRSKQIADKLFKLKAFRDSDHIAIYYPIHNEVDTKPIHYEALKLGKKIYYPRVTGDFITYHSITNFAQLKPGAYGISEPGRDDIAVPLNLIDIFIIPGICFDVWGNRIGFGKGYYDRTLKFTNKNKKIGLAYSFQVVSSIRTDMYDLPLSYIVSENGVINANRGGH